MSSHHNVHILQNKQRILAVRSAPPRFNMRTCVAVIIILLLATGVRFHQLGAQSLWNDEGNSYVQAIRSFGDIADHAGRDIHPPGYYWALAAWRLPIGQTEFALRALSAFAGVLTVAFVFALGKRLRGQIAAIAAAMFVALNTFSIFYAQETRMYSLLALWAVASMWALTGFVYYRSHRWALALALCNLAGLWTQYVYPLVMVAQGVMIVGWLLSHWRGADRQSVITLLRLYLLANGISIVLYLPWLPTALRQVTTWPNTGEPIALADAADVLLAWFTYGNTTQVTTFSTTAYLPAIMLLAAGLFIWPRHQASPSSLPRWWRTLLPIVWLVSMVGVFLALELFRFANLKLLLPAQAAFALWMGIGFGGLWSAYRDETRRWAGRIIALIAAIWLTVHLVAGLSPLYKDPRLQRADYRGIVSQITSHLQPGDAIILDAPNQEEVFRYYYAADAPVFPLPRGLGGDDAATETDVRNIIAEFDRAWAVLWGEDERDPNRVVETTFNEATFEVSSQWFGDVRLVRYVMPVALEDRVDSQTRFGDAIILQSYALNHADAAPGDVLQIQLDWMTEAPLDTRYKVFVQLLDEDGFLVAQRDREPGSGLALTTTWQPGTTVTDRHGLLLPETLPPGTYQLIVGLYDIDNPAERLPVNEDNFLPLATITIP
ncbi:MAG: hypothetical protein D6737_12025 [Chloroflexi bacterium]|nr:MAG: hypothetical protein D6737_12025 [Chloroflexota bacterium]